MRQKYLSIGAKKINCSQKKINENISVEPEAGETEGHEEGAEDGDDGGEGDPELGVDQVDLVE